MELLGENKFVKLFSILNFVQINVIGYIYILPKIVGLVNDFFVTSLPIKSLFFHWSFDYSNHSVSRDKLSHKTLRSTLDSYFNFIELMP
jgi:hypothetical protein